MTTRQYPKTQNEQAGNLQPFAGNEKNNLVKGLPFALTDYLQLVDWTSRQLRPGKQAMIPVDHPDILERLQLDQKHWLYLAQHFESPFKQLIGRAHHVRQACEALGQCWAQGIRQCEKMFSSG